MFCRGFITFVASRNSELSGGRWMPNRNENIASSYFLNQKFETGIKLGE